MKHKSLLIVFLFAFVIRFSLATPSGSMLLRIVADGQWMQNEAVVYFDSAATMAHNTQFDAPSLGTSGGYLNIVSHFNGINYRIKGLPALTQGISIPLRVTTGMSGSYLLYCSDLKNMPEGACIFLYDSLTGTNWDLRNGAYTCTIANSNQPVRFTLNIITSQLTSVSAAVALPACSHSADGEIVASVQGTGPWNYFWKDGMNNIIKSSLNKNAADTLPLLNAGNYRVDVNTAGTCNHSTLYFTLKGSQLPQAAFLADSMVSVQANILFTNTSSKSASYWWNFGDGMGSADTSPTYVYAAAGTYTVTLAAAGSVCADTSVASRIITVTGSVALSSAQAAQRIVVNRDHRGYFVEFNCLNPADALVTVYDCLGKQLQVIRRQNVSYDRVYLDTKDISGNMVLVSAQAGNIKTYRKLIVE